MAGSSTSYFGSKGGKGAGVKGTVFISNATIAKMGGFSPTDKAAMKAAKGWLNDLATVDTTKSAAYLGSLAAQSKQPGGQAKSAADLAAAQAAAQAKKDKKAANASKYAALLKEKGLPALDEKPKTTKGSVTIQVPKYKYSSESEPQEVEAAIYGDSGLAVNKTPNGGGWSVTHINSGLSTGAPLGTKAEAEALAETLLAAGVNLSGAADGKAAAAIIKANPVAMNAVKVAGAGNLKPGKKADDSYADMNAILKDAAAVPSAEKALEKAEKALEKAQSVTALATLIKAKVNAAVAANKPVPPKVLQQVAKMMSDAQKSKNASAVDSAEQTVRAVFKAVHGGVTLDSSEQSAMTYYQGSGYDSINPSLWSGTRDSVTGALSYDAFATQASNAIPALMSAAKKMSAPFAMTTYRTANADHPLTKWAASVNPGDLYVNKGFDSASFSPDFDPVAGGGKAATRVVFNVPQGAKGVYFNGAPGYDTGSFAHEKEWLVPANSTWRVASATVVNGIKVVTVDLLGQRDLDGSSIWP